MTSAASLLAQIKSSALHRLGRPTLIAYAALVILTAVGVAASLAWPHLAGSP